jgi:hypothetical protein
MEVQLAKIDVGNLLGGAGQLAKDIRTAITGKEPIDSTKAAELALQATQLEAELEKARMAVVLAEASSQDSWTSRARPVFMYVIYILILASIPMGLIYAFSPQMATSVAQGFGAWLRAIPDELYVLFGAGYLGYGAFRSFDKKTGAQK